MKILMTGGTGFVGKALCTLLSENEHQILILSRSKTGQEKLGHSSIQYIPWKYEQGTPPEEAFHNIDAIINLAGENIGEKRWSKEQKRKIFKSRILLTENLVKGINQYCLKNPPNVFISTSAVGYYGNVISKEDVVNESSARGKNFLANVCEAWEQETEKVLEEIKNNMRTVILRVGVVLGDGGGALNKMLIPFKLGLGGPIGFGEQWMSWIHLQDLALMYREALVQKDWQGIYNAVSPEPVTNLSFSKALARSLNRPCLFPVPVPAIKLLMGEMSALVLDSAKVSSERALNQGMQFQYPQIEKAFEQIIHEN